MVVEKRNFGFGKDETLVQGAQAKGDQVQLVGENFLQATVLPLGVAAHVNGEFGRTEAVDLRVQSHQFALQEGRICCPKAHPLCTCPHGSGLQPGIVLQLCFQPGGCTHELCRRRQFFARRPALVFGGGTRKGLFQFEAEVFGFVAEDQRFFEVGEQAIAATVEQVHITFDALQRGSQLQLVLEFLEVDFPGRFGRLDELLVFLAEKRRQQDFASRQDHGLRAGGERALGAGIEMADRFDFVIEKLQPQGVFDAERIDV